jgi:hypothetical protein
MTLPVKFDRLLFKSFSNKFLFVELSNNLALPVILSLQIGLGYAVVTAVCPTGIKRIILLLTDFHLSSELFTAVDLDT